MTVAPRPWLPAGLAAHGFTRANVARLAHVVVEEIVEGVVTLTVSAWPQVDERGRLRFRDVDAHQELALSLARLEAELYGGWLARLPRVGDVFAAELSDTARRWLAQGVADQGVADQGVADQGAAAVFPGPVAALVSGPVYDVTAESRTVAKLAFHAALATVLEPDVAMRWGLAVPPSPAASPVPRRAPGAD